MNHGSTPFAEANFEKIYIFLFVISLGIFVSACSKIEKESLHVWETLELTFQSELDYTNPYTEVELWVNLSGPESYNRRIRGFWDGGNRHYRNTKDGSCYHGASKTRECDMGKHKPASCANCIEANQVVRYRNKVTGNCSKQNSLLFG